MLKVIILFVCIATILADYSANGPLAWWDTDDFKDYKDQTSKRVPFPQCLVSGTKSSYFESSSLQKLFDKKIQEEEGNLQQERYENRKHGNSGLMDYDAYGSRNDHSKSRAAAAAAIGLTRDIMTVLACDLNGTDGRNLDKFLEKFKFPEELCTYRRQQDCDKKKYYRTPTGVCNNLERTYEGSAQTAFGRLLPALYEDHLSKPRRKSYRGGPLPSCRQISLALGTKPLFDRSYNNFFVIFGQFIAHDIALSTPVSDTYLTPISSCTCDSKQDYNKCNVIDIKPDDPYLGAQKCMAFPATAQAFKNQVCSLGVKEQMNGNSHFIDLSVLYGSSNLMAEILQSDKGKMKSTRRNWAKFEMPPGQREQKSCSDGTYDNPCLTGGDSRLMINLLFTAIDAMWLRAHNIFATDLLILNPGWNDFELYQEARKITIAIFQRIVYQLWLPTLFGTDGFNKYIGGSDKTTYDKDVSPVVYNEAATAAFRLHTLVRDLFSRCTPDANRIDQLWLHDISHKAKYAYDIKNNGLDSIICGSFYDYGFSPDGNFAHQIRDRLFETTNNYKQLWRNDLVAINICRGREHGLPTYNSLREYCGYPKAYYFEDFGDTINYDGINVLQKLYKSTDDVDLFVALNLEDTLPGALIGPTSACILGKQFKALRDGDRLFYSHDGVFEENQLTAIQSYPFYCFICQVVDIDQVPLHPFKPPNDDNNELQDCKSCPAIDLSAWKETEVEEETD